MRPLESSVFPKAPPSDSAKAEMSFKDVVSVRSRCQSSEIFPGSSAQEDLAIIKKQSKGCKATLTLNVDFEAVASITEENSLRNCQFHAAVGHYRHRHVTDDCTKSAKLVLENKSPFFLATRRI